MVRLGNKARKTLCGVKKFAGAIKKTGKINGVWKIDPDNKWELKYATDLFHSVFKYFYFAGTKSLSFQRRYEASSWKTTYSSTYEKEKDLLGKL